tara:strand:+ start:198 stop:362 length:165 start_codon:yes stop_codon:yes gene_type:complete
MKLKSVAVRIGKVTLKSEGGIDFLFVTAVRRVLQLSIKMNNISPSIMKSWKKRK